jgi:hypothetical protein
VCSTMAPMLPRALVGTSLILLASHAVAQQTYVGRFDAYGGFTYLNSPKINLIERGFQMQVGVRPKSWYTLGFDYSVATGHTALTPNLLTTALQNQFGTQFGQLAAAGRLPPGYSLVVPIDSTTQNFAAGPQLSYRHWSLVTLFIRPSIGAVHETATARTTDPLEALVITQLAPSGQKKDWAGFYGVGGGFDVNVSPRIALRFQADFVHDHLFSDLLKDGRNTVRVGIGPAFQIGHNVMK